MDIGLHIHIGITSRVGLRIFKYIEPREMREPEYGVGVHILFVILSIGLSWERMS